MPYQTISPTGKMRLDEISKAADLNQSNSQKNIFQYLFALNGNGVTDLPTYTCIVLKLWKLWRQVQ